ncbi:MAG: SxtJ family membrane protein [Thermoanaerobaculia bacterium]
METPTARKEREFGLLVGAIVFAIASWWLYRGRHGMAARPLLLLGLSLMILGALFPSSLRHPYRLWMALAEGISFVMTRVILAIVFFAIVTPIGLLRKAFGGDPLRRRSRTVESFWLPYSQRQSDLKHYEKMF